MEDIQKDLIRLCNGYPEGLSLLEINGLYQRTHGKPLCIGTTKRLQTLLRSMPEHLHLCTNGGMVVWPAAYRPSSSSSAPPLPSPPTSLAGAAAACQGPRLASSRSVSASRKQPPAMTKPLAKIVTLINDFPDGVLVNKLVELYKEKYSKNLSLASLGFSSMAHLLASLDHDVVVEGELVFHQSHWPPRGAGTAPEARRARGPPRPCTTDQIAPQEAGEWASTSASAVVDRQPAKARKKRDRSSEVGISFGSFSPAPPNLPAAMARHTEKLSQDQLLQSVRQEAAPPRRLVHTPNLEAPTPLSTMATPKDSKLPWREPKQNPLPSGLSDEDFPSLAAGVAVEPREPTRITPTRQRAEREEERRSGPVFMDAYHAQQRRVNAGNMQAVDALEEEGQTRYRTLDAEKVNSLAEDVIRDLAAEGELVTHEKVLSKICILMQAPSLKSMKILQARHIPAVKELQYTIREINMFLESMVAATSICTLYELGQSLAGLKDKKRYEELNLGPLCKLSNVHRFFKIDSNTKDDDIPQIETVDILKSLRLFRRQNVKHKVDLAEFMKYLSDQHCCDSPYELGIRIHSVGLPIATLSKVTRCEHLYLERAQQLIQRELEEEVQERMRKVKRSVMDPFTSSSTGAGSLELRKKYVSMAAAEVVLEVFTKARDVFGTKANKCVQDFLLLVGSDRLSTAMFQLAICGGSLAVPHDLVAREKPAKAAAKPATHEPAVALPSEDAVKQFLKDKLSNQNTALTLADMASLEKKLNQHFKLPEFGSLKKGTFLDFLVKHVQLLQEMVGGAIALGSSGGAELQGCGFRPSRQDVFEFIKQCGPFTSTEPDALVHIERALRCHYRVRDSRDLGFGPLRRLAELVKRQRDLLGGGGCIQVHYETALFQSSRVDVGAVSVGLLGEVSQEQALASLLSCPLLVDLEQWSQWESVFKPVHGLLKEFLEKNAALPANSELAALEVCPGVLLRITTATGNKHFSQAAMALDPVGTAGHLVSMAVAEGVANVSAALLANHMESALAEGVVRADVSPAEDDESCVRMVARYLLESLTLIPPTSCQALLQQVFLEPMYRVLGQANSKTILLTTARSDPRHLNRLHQIAIRLGVTEWITDYQKSKLHRPQPREPLMATGAHSKYDLVDSASGYLSALNLDGGEEDDDDLEEPSKDDSSETSSISRQRLPTESEREDVEEEEEEALYELVYRESLSGPLTASESDGGQEACKTDPSDPGDVEGEEEDAADCDAKNSQRALIEDIRKTQFGVGLELTAECKKLMAVHQDRLGRSLDRLSTELYSKDAHFVLELIQNADDNSYRVGEGEALPALALVVEKDRVTILNNEMGFQEHNIRAICDVGRSTKGKHKYGYIGQKGIGFKSVFKVTDCPEIHSNGFHLRFDKTSGPMGYILPHWLEDERPLDLPQLPGTAQHSWTTKICLPLRSENQQRRNLFHDVHPSLLLFLHRLRSITIDNQCERRVVTMTRRDRTHNILEVEHRSQNAQEAEPTVGTERWLVIKRMLEPKKIKEEVESTELALAFLLADSDIMALPQKQPVFAFLPLRSFGFRFIVQGDFAIPSSREDVDRDSSWNQWLRSEIPQLFVQALDVFNDHPEFSGMKGLVHFLQFVPLPDEVLDFFKPVAKQIIQLLKGKAFLPTLNSEREVEYKLPSQVAVCQDSVIRNVIGREELDRHLSLAYLHPRLQPLPPASLLTHLGVRHLMGTDVTTVTTAMARELTQGGELDTDKGLRRLARLLVCNFRALENGYGEAEPILQALRELPIIPLADGRVVALSSTSVFFPMEKAEMTTKKKGKRNPAAGPFAALYEDVSVVLPALLACEKPLEAQQVCELLRRLGVHTLEPQQLLEQHIYPALRNHTWKDKPDRVVVSYLVYIKQYGSASSWPLSDATVPVLTSRGLLCPQLNRVHFSLEYNNVDLPRKLPGCDWLLLSPCYVETDGDVGGWRDFFLALGVRDLLIIRKERCTLDASQLASSPWAGESGSWPQDSAEGGYVVDDYPCEEFYSLATAQLPNDQLLEQRRALLELLENNWQTGERYSQYITAHVITGGKGDCNEGRQAKIGRSSFFHFLLRLPWLPAYRQLEGGGRQVRFIQPDAAYLRSPEVYCLLGTHVCYVDARHSELSQALGMRFSITVDDMISYLQTWSARPGERADQDPDPAPQAREFTSTVQHIYKVYYYLQKNCSQGSLKDLFQHTPAVFVEHQRRADGWTMGRFYHLREVCWKDPTSMFMRYSSLVCVPDMTLQDPRVLAPFYSSLEGMREFFRYLNVEPSPTMYQYVALLELVCSSCPMPTAEVLQDVSVIYACLALKCKTAASADQDYMDPGSQPRTNDGYCATLKGMVSDKRVFPTKDKTWVTLARRPLIADDRALEKIFRPHPGVCLLNLPPADKKSPGPAFKEEDRALFLEICGVRLLSCCVRTEAQTENLRPCPMMQALVRAVVPYVQRFLYHQEELVPVYQELLNTDIGQKIQRLQYRQVGKLYIRYELSAVGNGNSLDLDQEGPLVEMEDVVCLLKDDKELYIQKDHLSAKLDICRELAKLFCTELGQRKELVDFLSGLMTSLDDPVSLKRFLQKETVRELPSEEEPWEVPEPPRPELPQEGAPSRESAPFGTPEEAPRRRDADGEQTLACWPPRAPMGSMPTSNRTGVWADSDALDAVMKMWPPPAPPKDQDPDRPKRAHLSSSGPSPGTPCIADHGAAGPPLSGQPRPTATDHTHPGSPSGSASTASGHQPPEGGRGQHQGPSASGPAPRPSVGERRPEASSPEHPKMDLDQHPAAHLIVPEVVVASGVFQGTEGIAQRPPLVMDFPQLNKSLGGLALTLEDMEVACVRPTTVVLKDDTPGDLEAIGAWGEQLVNSFLCHWRDGEAADRPSEVSWCNQRAESGQPYDFELTFADRQVYVEVKSTVKRDKAFIRLSANELDFALKERERYHIFRVYSVGDALNVRLCRIRNLAQMLHAKELELFLFV